jgi:O-acetyl-ADP-ribose deacetylase (regulator of RNase III)
LLAGCYRTALELAASRKLTSVAFPAISTGIYRFPLERAADALQAVIDRTIIGKGVIVG